MRSLEITTSIIKHLIEHCRQSTCSEIFGCHKTTMRFLICVLLIWLCIVIWNHDGRSRSEL